MLSPERYVRNKNNKVISQPIKGTESRGSTIESDKKNKKLINVKRFSENVMIVDLVRNDLSITAKKNTVKVEELAKLYSYKNVHHLISQFLQRLTTIFTLWML